MILELQMTALKFATLVRERAKTQEICHPGTTFLGEQGKVLDHVELTAGTSLQATGSLPPVSINQSVGPPAVVADVAPWEVYQPIIVWTTTIAGLDAALPPQDEFPSHPAVKFRFHVQVPSDPMQAPQLCVEAFLPPGAEDVDPPAIPCVPIDLSAIQAVLKQDVKISNAGIAMSETGEFIAIRFEIGTPAPTALQSWSAFFQGKIQNRVANTDWALFIDPGFIVPLVVDEIASGLASSSSDPKFDIQAGPSGSWSSSSVVVNCSGELVDACQCLWGEIDLNVDLTFTTTFSVQQPSNDTLTIDVNIDSSATNGFEVACCVVTGALIGGVIGGVALGGLGAIIGAIVGIIVAIVKLDGLGGGASPPPDCIQVSDTHLVCTWPVDLSLGELGTLTLASATGASDGLVLGGPMTLVETNYPALLHTQTDFEWAYPNCSASTLVGTASATLYRDPSTATPWVPLHFCYAAVLDDPPLGKIGPIGGQYDSQDTSSGGKVEVQATVSQGASDYPCRLLVLTTLGARLFQISAPPALSQQEQLMLFTTKLLACMTLTNSFWQTDVAILLTLPDPPPEVEAASLWQTVVYGLQPTDTVALKTVGGRTVATARPSNGVVQLSAFVPPEHAGEGLNLAHGGPVGKSISKKALATRPVGGGQPLQAAPERFVLQSGRGVRIKGVRLVREASIPLNDRGNRLCAGFFRGAPSLFLSVSAGLRVYDVSTPHFPRLVHLVLLQGISGQVFWQGRLLAWGGPGLVLFSSELSYLGELEGSNGRSVLDVAVTRTHLYVAKASGVDIYDSRLARVGQVAVDQPDHVAGIGDRLVVGSRRGLELFNPRSPQSERTGVYEIDGVAGLLRPEATSGRDTVFVRSLSGGGTVLDLNAQSGIEEIAQFAEDPWFVDSARIGRTLGRLETGTTTLTVYGVARTVEDLSRTRDTR